MSSILGNFKCFLVLIYKESCGDSERFLNTKSILLREYINVISSQLNFFLYLPLNLRLMNN